MTATVPKTHTPHELANAEDQEYLERVILILRSQAKDCLQRAGYFGEINIRLVLNDSMIVAGEVTPRQVIQFRNKRHKAH